MAHPHRSNHRFAAAVPARSIARSTRMLFWMLLASLLSLSWAVAADPPNELKIPVKFGDKTLGEIRLHVGTTDFTNAGNTGIGRTTADGEKSGFYPAGGMTLDQMAMMAGEHHFNWLQIVTMQPAAHNIFGAVPHADPSNSVNNPQPRDMHPWYMNESDAGTRPNPAINAPFDLPAGTAKLLEFQDFPGGDFLEGEMIAFCTYLVSIIDPVKKTYDIHAGFDWKLTWTKKGGEANARLHLAQLEQKSTLLLPKAYQDLVKDYKNKGWTLTYLPEKSADIVYWAGETKDKNPIVDIVPAGGKLKFAWTNGEKDPTTGQMKRHPNYVEYMEMNMTDAAKALQFKRPNDRTITDWRQEVQDASGKSTVYAGNLVRDEVGFNFNPLADLPQMAYRIPDLAPLTSDPELTIYTAVDLGIYLEANPMGFNNGNYFIGQPLFSMSLDIINGRIAGLEGIYFATSEFTFDPLSETGWVPINGDSGWLNSIDFQQEVSQLRLIGIHEGVIVPVPAGVWTGIALLGVLAIHRRHQHNLQRGTMRRMAA